MKIFIRIKEFNSSRVLQEVDITQAKKLAYRPVSGYAQEIIDASTGKAPARMVVYRKSLDLIARVDGVATVEFTGFYDPSQCDDTCRFDIQTDISPTEVAPSNASSPTHQIVPSMSSSEWPSNFDGTPPDIVANQAMVWHGALADIHAIDWSAVLNSGWTTSSGLAVLAIGMNSSSASLASAPPALSAKITSNKAAGVTATGEVLYTIQFNYSLDIQGLSWDDIKVTGGTSTLKNLVRLSDTTYTLLVTPTAQTNAGELTVEVTPGKIQDISGAFTLKQPQISTIQPFDTAAPVLTITNADSVGAIARAGDLTYQFNFNEPTYLLIDNINVTGATRGTFTKKDASRYTLQVHLTDGVQAGEVQGSVNTNGVTDLFGNARVGTVSSSRQAYDSLAPTVTSITSNKSSLGAGDAATLFFQFSEPVQNLKLSDIDLPADTLNFLAPTNADHSAWQVTYTPKSSVDALTVRLKETVLDLAGNTLSTTLSNNANLTVDTNPPTVTIQSNQVDQTAAGNVLYTFAFNKDVGDSFSATDVNVSNGSKQSHTFKRLDATHYTILVTPPSNNQGAMAVSVAEHMFQDLVGNGNTQSFAATSQSFDTRSPTVTVTASNTLLAEGASTLLTFHFNKAIYAFPSNWVTASDGTTLIPSPTDDATIWTARYSPPAGKSSQNVTVSIDQSQFHDAGNMTLSPSGNASPPLTVDTQPPTTAAVKVQGWMASGSLATTDPIDTGGTLSITLTVSEPLVQAGSGSPELLVSIGGKARTFILDAGQSKDKTLVFKHTVVDNDAGVVNLSGAQMSLNGLTFKDAAGNLLNVQLPDGATELVRVVNDRPQLTWSEASWQWREGSGPQTITTGTIKIQDVDSTGFVSAKVEITAGGQPKDELTLAAGTAGIGNIKGDFGNGVLQLSSANGSANAAHWEAALHAITFSNSSSTPGSTRTLSYTINDGVSDSAVAAVQMAVTDVNQAPVLTLASSALMYTERSRVSIDSGLSVRDSDGLTLKTVTFQIANVLDAGAESLSFTPSAASDDTNTGDIQATVTGNALTLTSSSSLDSLAQWQAALRAVVYTNTSHTSTTSDDSTTDRVIQITVDDGANNNATTQKTRAIHISAVNEAPVVTLDASASALSYIENDSPKLGFSGPLVTDLDSTTLASAVIKITNGYQDGADALNWSAGAEIGDITVVSNTNGTLRLTANTATVAQWQSALRTITYVNTSDSPTADDRVLTLTVNDGAGGSATVTSTIAVHPVNDPPVMASSVTIGNFLENTSYVLRVGDFGSYSDVDGPSLWTQLKIATLPTKGQLEHQNSDNTWSPLSGGDVFAYADIQGSKLRYVPAARDNHLALAKPSFGIETMDDQGASSNPCTVTFDVTPVPNILSANIDGLRSGGAVTNSNLKAGDVIRVTLTTDQAVDLSGTSSTEASLRLQLDSGRVSAKLNPTLSASTGRLVFDYTVADSDGGHVTWSNGTTLDLGSRQIMGGDGGQTLLTALPNAASNAWVVDTTPPSIQSMTLQGFMKDALIPAADTAVIDTGGVFQLHLRPTESLQRSLGTPEITARLGLASVKFVYVYSKSSDNDLVFEYQVAASDAGQLDLSNATMAFKTWRATDLAGNELTTSLPTLSTSLRAFNDPPVLSPNDTTNGMTMSWTEGDGLQPISTAWHATDADSAGLVKASITFISGYQADGDKLNLTVDPNTMGNIQADWQSATGTLILRSPGGSATPAEWQAALDAVKYNNTSTTPGQTSRVLTYVINDGSSDSVVQAVTINVTDVNTPPELGLSSGLLSYTERGAPVPIDNGLSVSDIDSTTLHSATVTIDNVQDPDLERLIFSVSNSTGNIQATQQASGSDKSILTLSSTGGAATMSQWQAALRAVSYQDSSHNPNTLVKRNVIVTVDDGASAHATSMQTRQIQITTVNDAPALAGTASNALQFTEGDSALTAAANMTVNDADNLTLSKATIHISDNYQSGADILALPTGLDAAIGNISATWASGTGALELTSSGNAATLAQWQAALQAVTFTNTSQKPTGGNRTLTFTINDGSLDSNTVTQQVNVTPVNDAPTITALPALGGILESASARVLTVADFGTYNDVDGAGTWDRVKVTSLPSVSAGGGSGSSGAGTLQRRVVGVWGDVIASADSTNNVLTQAEVQNGDLRYVPSLGVNHITASPSFQFKVSDGQGATGGDYSSDYTATLDITPVPNITSATLQGLRSSTVVTALKTSDILRVTLTLDQAVYAGTDATAEAYVPIQLATGNTPVRAAFNSSLSSGATLVFDYAVQAGDDTTQVSLSSGTQVALGSRAIAGADGGQAMTVDVPVVTNSSLQIDTHSPSVSIASSLASGSKTNSAITYTFNLSEAPAAGAWTAGDVVASYVPASGGMSTSLPTSSLTLTDISSPSAPHSYSLTITPPSGVTGTLTVSVNAGVLTDAAGNENTAATSVSNLFDTQPPVVSGVSMGSYASNGTTGVSTSLMGGLSAGRKIIVDVTMDEPVTVTGGTPYYLLNIGGARLKAIYDASISTSTKLRFVHTVGYGEYDTDGSVGAVDSAALHLNGATLVDAVGNAIAASTGAVATVTPASNTIYVNSINGTPSADTFDLYNTGFLLSGNGGADVFKYHASTGVTDSIQDFTLGLPGSTSDAGTIDLSALLPSGATTITYASYLKLVEITPTGGGAHYAELQVFQGGDASTSSTPSLKVDLLGVTPSGTYADLLATLVQTNHQIIL
ncbi:Ig-like domain-containing protein [Limnohabitans sp.]|uniref:Ig-like domain-containing protein n=1 Tax=Limnohabitans sp. TaxID=1907725 RepID=UPI00286F53F6|nr:Ig-like domain-containing protein [Limnohabitans sp.]